MVTEFGEIKRGFELFKESEMKNKKRFTLDELEEFLLAQLGGVSAYQKNGAYQGLYQLLKSEEKRGHIVAIKSSALNGRNPALKTRWQLLKEPAEGWAEELIFKLSRRLDLGYYLKRPQLQSAELAFKLKRLDQFLAEKDNREWASREERALELFDDEKFLAESEGKRLLSRLKLSLADIKAEKYSQMFVYWQNEKSIKEILILENHGAFIACKRALEAGVDIFSFMPDTLIFGGGQQIIKSLKFIDEIADLEQLKIKYAGDLDPAGLQIYINLKEKYTDLSVELHLDYYQAMILSARKYSLNKEQYKDSNVLNKFIAEFKDEVEEEIIGEIKKLWDLEMRIPQEIITFEKLIKFDFY